MNIAETVSAALRDADLRCHFNKLPRERTIPAIVITMIAGFDDVDLSGDASLRNRVMQLDVWASTRTGADAYMESAKTAMLAATTFTVGDIRESGADGIDDEANLYRASLEFSIWLNG